MTLNSLSEMSTSAGSISGTGYRPWWGALRSYCLFTLYAVSLIMMYINDSVSTVKCTPSVNGEGSLTRSAASFANSVCYYQIHKVFRRAGIFALIGSTAIHLSYNFWVLFPVVTSRFSTVKRVDELLEKKFLSRMQFRRIVTMPKRDAESAGFQNAEALENVYYLVQDACRRLYIGKYGFISIPVLYLAKSLIAASTTGVAAWLVVRKFYVKLQDGNSPTFNCTLDNTTATSVGIAKFVCSNDLPNQLIPYTMAISILLISMEFLSLIGVIMVVRVLWRTDLPHNASKNAKLLVRDYALVEMFSQHSNSLHGSTKEALSLVCDSVLAKMQRNLSEAIRHGNKDFLHMFWSLHQKGEKLIEQIIEEIAKKGLTKDPLLKESKNDYRLLLEEFPEIFHSFYSGAKYITFIKLHYIIYSSETFRHDYKGCCSNIKFSKKELKEETFWSALEVDYYDCWKPIVVLHVLSKFPVKANSVEFDSDDNSKDEQVDEKLRELIKKLNDDGDIKKAFAENLENKLKGVNNPTNERESTCGFENEISPLLPKAVKRSNGKNKPASTQVTTKKTKF